MVMLLNWCCVNDVAGIGIGAYIGIGVDKGISVVTRCWYRYRYW